MSADIIDVSKFQNVIDWPKVTASVVCVRVGYRSGQSGEIKADEFAQRNLDGARATGKKVGVYFWSQALTIDEARAEADYACDHAGKLDLPVYIDSEYSSKHNGRADRLTKDARTVVTVAFCTRVMERGYQAGVYASESWYKSNLDFSKISAYHIWVAKYSDKRPTYPPKWEYWQYSSKASMPGIIGNVDVSRKYADKQEPKKQILIGQASIGEDGINHQKPGNQTGKELNTRDYYKPSKGWRVFRTTPERAHKIAFAMLQAVNNPCIGYDQSDRNTLFTASQKYGYDPSKVKIDVECDCSSLVRVCVAYSGIILPDFNTSLEPTVLKDHGFNEITIDQATGAGLQIGDILVTNGKGHTCVCVQA